MPRKPQWKRDGTSDRPKSIDLRLDGLPTRGQRLQVSSGVLTRSGYELRQRAIQEAWAMGGVWRESVIALARKRVTVGQWYDAKQKGTLAHVAAQAHAEPLADLVRDYLTQCEAEDREKMRQRLERFAAFLGSAPMATDLTTANVTAFLSGLTNLRTKHTPTPASGSTRNRYRAVIGGLCTWAVKVGRLTVHPIAGKKVAKAAEAHHRLPELSADEYRDYLAAVRALRPDFAVLYLLLIHTACDVGELWRVEAKDVDLERGRIRYARSKVTASRPRWVPMPSFVLAEVRAHLAEHGLRGSARLFSMVRRPEVVWIHEKARAAIVRPELTMKDLRHVAAIAWVKAGVHIRLVSRWLGHTSLSQTMKYTDYEPEDAVAAAMAERAAQTLNQTSDVTPLRKAQ